MHDQPTEGTMKIRFTGAERICIDGIHPVDFHAGQEAEIPDRIAAVLLAEGRAGLPEEAKALTGAPENKMEPGRASDKTRGRGASKKR